MKRPHTNQRPVELHQAPRPAGRERTPPAPPHTATAAHIAAASAVCRSRPNEVASAVQNPTPAIPRAFAHPVFAATVRGLSYLQARCG